MTKIWIDGQCLQTLSKVRGIGRYVQELIAALSQQPNVELSISFNASMAAEAIAARDFVGAWIERGNIHVWEGVAESGEAIGGYSENRKLSEIAIAHHVASLGPDIALSVSPFEGEMDLAVPLLPSPILDLPIASIFYDAIPLRFAKQYLPTSQARARYTRRLNAYRKFSVNLCISEFARQELVKITGNKHSVNISAGVSPSILSLIETSPEYPALAGSKYALYVGALDWRKNVLTLIDAFAALPLPYRNSVKLVIAGDQDANRLNEVVSRWRHAGLPRTNIRPLGFVPDQELVGLYRSAALVVQPSLMEGFGLTALEAMSCGTPVIGSRTGALPEVIGRQDLMFDPLAIDQIASHMLSILQDPEGARQVAQEGMKRAREFSWTKTARIATEALNAATQRGSRAKAVGRSDLQMRTSDVLSHIKGSPQIKANVLARAEPVPSPPRSRLIVDATVTSINDHATGIQRVVKKISYNLLKQSSDDQDPVIAYCDWDELWFSLPEGWKNSLPSVAKTDQRRLQLASTDTVLMLDSSWEFHARGFSSLHRARLRGANVISCLYDTVPLRYPAFCDPGMPPAFARWITSALTYSTGFVCISKAVADELIVLLEAIKFPRPINIGYWHLGADFASPPARSASRNRSVRPRFLMVGTIEPRKGHRVALDAFERLWQSGLDTELWIVGKPGWGNEELIERLHNHPEARERLRWEPKVSDEELQGLYRDADALIAASFAEGFGLPIVEARHFGRPVIASDIPVFREVTAGSKSVQFFDAGSPNSLADTIVKFISAGGGVGAEHTDQSSWVDWEGSAAELREVVSGRDWYYRYRPASRNPLISIFDIGHTTMRAPVLPKARRHQLELVEGPVRVGDQLKIVIKVTNLSDGLWSSYGSDSGRYGVMLGYHALDRYGTALPRDYPRATIPFVLAPGDSSFLALYVPPTVKREGGVAIDVELVQEHVTWWGDPLRIGID